MRLGIVTDLEKAKRSKGDCIFQIKIKEMAIKGRFDERRLKERLEKIPPSRKDGGAIKYVAIDVSRVEMNPSNLLRILAYLSYHTRIPVIVYNAPVVVFLAMIRDNRRYYQGLPVNLPSVPYWFKDRAILVYSYMEGGKFYFADILYGHDEMEFLNVNLLASRSFPNAVSITRPGSVSGVQDVQINGILAAFFQNSVLAPFDIMLEDLSGKQLIFLRNLTTTLDKNVYGE